ncbi:18213_t:CDS:10, partial [Rhizophagus irregularis]
SNKKVQSTTTTNARTRKQKSRTAMTDEQKTNILEQDKLAHQTRYAAQQEQSKNWDETKGFCCLDGQKPYVDNIGAYNSIFAFTTLGGALYHRIGGLMPKENYPPAFAQIYFYDSNMDNQLKRRQENFLHLNSDMLTKSINNIDDMRLIIHKIHGKNMRQYNKPTASEVAVIFLDFNYFNQVPNPRDINMDGMIDLLIGSEISRINKDQYAKWESNNLRWYRNNQQNLRQEIYSGLQDFTSDMQQLYQDSMAIVNELLPNQQASDRSDLVIRVFKLKLKSITHDLFIKAPKDKPRISDDFDKLVCAEIPDEQQQPLLYETVSRGRLNPNLPCIENGKCNDERKIIKTRTTIDNRWIVPYNPYLYQKYNCHINVEICLKRSHKVGRLPVHLSKQQSVIFQENQDITTILEQFSHTKLTCYFETCASNQEDLTITSLCYIDFPKHFVWKNGSWQSRKKGGEKVISRMYMCNIQDKERNYLKLLLTQIHRAISYEAIHTINGIVYNTFEEANHFDNLNEDYMQQQIMILELPDYSLIEDFQQSDMIMEELNYDSTEFTKLFSKCRLQLIAKL